MKPELIAPIIQAVASLAWPLVLGFALYSFKEPLVDVSRRLMKAEVLGQKVELRDDLERLNASTKATSVEAKVYSERSLSDPKQIEAADAEIHSIIEKAATDPKLALIALSTALERKGRLALATRGILGNRKAVSLTQALAELAQYGFPPNLAGSLQLFLDVRNKIVHGETATNDDALRALDSGLTLLRVLDALPNETNIVYHPGVDLFFDANGTRSITDARGLMLETTSPGRTMKTFRIFPTTHKNYEKGKQVTWEWNMDKTWPQAWYRDPDTHKIERAWDQSGEFVGRHIDDVQ
jgi:hypothetical protein